MRRLLAFYVFLLCSSFLLAQTDKIEEIKQKLEGAESDSVRINLLFDLAEEVAKTNDFEVLTYARQACQLAEKSGGDQQLARSYKYLGYGHYFQDNYDSSVYYYNKALPIFLKLGDLREASIVYKNKGEVIGYGFDQWDSALVYTQYADSLALVVRDRSLLMEARFGSARIHAALDLTEDAIRLYEEVIQYYERKQDSLMLFRSYRNIAGAYYSLYNDQKSYEYNKKALELGNQDNRFWLNLHVALGNSSTFLGRFDEALSYFKTAEEGYTEQNDTRKLIYLYQAMTNYYILLGDAKGDASYYHKALEFAQLGKDISNKGGFADTKLGALEGLIYAYKKLEDFEQALHYQEELAIVNDSINKQNVKENFARLRTEYETEKKEQQIAMQQAALTQQTNQRNMLIAGIVLMLLIVGLVYRSERLKARKNKQIEALLKEIHHRVKNNLQVISSLLNMQSRNLEDEGMLGAIREGQNRVKAMSLIHQKLYQNDNVTEIDFQEYASELSKQLAAVFNRSQQRIRSEVKGDVRLDIDTAIPLGLILNELISNAYKYAFEGKEEGNIQIMLDRIDKGELELKVKDDGKGIPADFDLKKVKSLGLKLVNILTKQLRGSWEYSNNNGTEFLIRFKEVAVAS